MRVDLCWLGSQPPPPWTHGNVLLARPTVAEVAAAMQRSSLGDAAATLFWDADLGIPPASVRSLASGPAEVVHAGLLLGTAGAPSSIDFVAGTWMWSIDPPAEIEATSWRLSLRACLIRHDVIRQLGGVRTEFRSLDAAALELGHRYLTRGAFVRHDPALCDRPKPQALEISLHDDLLIARMRYGVFWARWALARGLLTGVYRAGDVADASSALFGQDPPPATFVRSERDITVPANARVSVIMPTIERYPYLRPLLPQLAAQTYPIHEIIIVDQTPLASRDLTIAEDFPDLPIRIVYQEIPGQCSARNEALRLATGDYALFIDDDDEVEPDLVERHLRTLTLYGVDVCCGVAESVGAGPVPEYQQFLRASDVFPTNNTMIRRDVLRKSGMFDLAYDCKMCEDADLGTRLYLAGVLMVLDSRISVLHHHAPRGGLRQHGARAITYASSRQKITHRNLPHLSEVYLGMRYYSPRQQEENLMLRTMGTLRSKGNLLHQGLKAAYAMLALPDTMHKVSKAREGARELFAEYPQIDPLPE